MSFHKSLCSLKRWRERNMKIKWYERLEQGKHCSAENLVEQDVVVPHENHPQWSLLHMVYYVLPPCPPRPAAFLLPRRLPCPYLSWVDAGRAVAPYGNTHYGQRDFRWHHQLPSPGTWDGVSAPVHMCGREESKANGKDPRVELSKGPLLSLLEVWDPPASACARVLPFTHKGNAILYNNFCFSWRTARNLRCWDVARNCCGWNERPGVVRFVKLGLFLLVCVRFST